MIKFAPRTAKPLLRRWLHRGARFVRAVVMLEDTPRRIALGSAIGIFYAAQPFLISQMVFAAITARLLRANVLASLPWTWLTNPLTVAPFYYGAYCLGRVFWGGEGSGYERFQAIAQRFEETGIMEFFQGGWRDLLRLVADIAIPLQLGTLLIGIAAAVPGYFAIHRVVAAVQRRRSERRARWNSARAPAIVEGAS